MALGTTGSVPHCIPPADRQAHVYYTKTEEIQQHPDNSSLETNEVTIKWFPCMFVIKSRSEWNLLSMELPFLIIPDLFLFLGGPESN